MSCSSCNCSPCACQGTSGTPWATPNPGAVVVLPFGSKAIQTPQAYPCNAEQTEATAIAAAGASPASPACPSPYPSVAAEFIVANVGSTGQFRSACASAWAIPGMAVWIPPFGNIEILGVTGELVTYRNLSVPSGTTIAAGTRMLPTGPAASVPGTRMLNVSLSALASIVFELETQSTLLFFYLVDGVESVTSGTSNWRLRVNGTFIGPRLSQKNTEEISNTGVTFLENQPAGPYSASLELVSSNGTAVAVNTSQITIVIFPTG